jgi:putative ABC transport system permease protein
MFDRTQAIKSWIKKIQATGNFEDGDVDELESHLTERIQSLCTTGYTEEDAFNKAVAETGSPEALGMENKFARERKAWRVTRTFLPALLVNYLKIMARQFNRHKAHNWVTIAGLAIGLTACFFIAFYSLHELSYDKTYTNKSIYRVVNHSISSTDVEKTDSGGPVPLGPALQDEFPEIKNTVRFWKAYMPIVRHQDKIFQEKEFVFVDTSVFRVFDFKLNYGNANSVFALPNSVILSTAAAKKYFKDENPVGNVIEYNGYPGDKISFTITGVFETLPSNTHFSFDFLASIHVLTLDPDNAGWGSFKSIWTYVELGERNTVNDLESKFPPFITKYLKSRKENSKEFSFRLEPVSSIHLHSQAARSMKAGGNLALIKILGMTGILILVMSCVNFVNISLAKAMVRMKEVGMRKVLGALRHQLLFQLIMEIVIAFAISLLISISLIVLFSGTFSVLTGIRITVSAILTWQFGLVLLSVFILVVILAGYFPSKTLSSFGILESLRQKPGSSGPRSTFSFRNALIFIQFAISAMLILSTLIVTDQLSFIEKKNLGLALDKVVAIPCSENPEAFENWVRSLPNVESLGYSQRLPVNTLNYDGRTVEVPGIEDKFSVESTFITPEFIDTYKIALLTGRNLNLTLASDSNKFLINETAMNSFGFNLNNVLGQKLIWSGGLPGEVVGVVKDFHLESVHTPIPPMVMLIAGDVNSSWQRNFISIRFKSESSAEILERIEAHWHELNPEQVFYAIPMTNSYTQLHTDDFKFSKIISYFTLIAIFISGIGLYAVSSYTAERKRKEIGIRKVLGSSMHQITLKLITPYLYITLASLLLAVPIVVWGMNKWLKTFAYYTEIKWGTILLASVIVTVLTLISVLKESVLAALLNPIKFLREE